MMYSSHHFSYGFHSPFAIRSTLPQGVSYRVDPPLPEGVMIDEEGTIYGAFVGMLMWGDD